MNKIVFMKNKLILKLIFCIICLNSKAQSPISFYASPNPCDSYTNIFFTTSQKDTLSLGIYNMTGSLITSVFSDAVLPAGTYSVNYITSNLSDGFYVMILKINSKYNGARLIKMNSVGLNNNTMANTDVVIFPNPFNDYLNIISDNTSNVEIYDLSGKLVLKEFIVNNIINVSNLANGTYNLKVYTKDNLLIKNKKIVKLNK